jgi:hypothetical protein
MVKRAAAGEGPQGIAGGCGEREHDRAQAGEDGRRISPERAEPDGAFEADDSAEKAGHHEGAVIGDPVGVVLGQGKIERQSDEAAPDGNEQRADPERQERQPSQPGAEV